MTIHDSKGSVAQPPERTSTARTAASSRPRYPAKIPQRMMRGFPDDHRIYGKRLARLPPRRSMVFDFVGYGCSERIDGAHFLSEAHEVEIAAVLDAQHERALALGARLLRDRSNDPDEPLRVYADPAGHPFCIFVAPPPNSPVAGL